MFLVVSPAEQVLDIAGKGQRENPYTTTQTGIFIL